MWRYIDLQIQYFAGRKGAAAQSSPCRLEMMLLWRPRWRTAFLEAHQRPSPIRKAPDKLRGSVGQESSHDCQINVVMQVMWKWGYVTSTHLQGRAWQWGCTLSGRWGLSRT